MKPRMAIITPEDEINKVDISSERKKKRKKKKEQRCK